MVVCNMIVAIIWALCGLLCFVQNQESIEQMETASALTAYIIFITFGPCFILINILENILGWLGWEDNDDDGHGV